MPPDSRNNPAKDEPDRTTRLNLSYSVPNMPYMLDGVVEKVPSSNFHFMMPLFNLLLLLRLEYQPPRTFQTWSTHPVEFFLQ